VVGPGWDRSGGHQDQGSRRRGRDVLVQREWVDAWKPKPKKEHAAVAIEIDA
jgi:hypothetical protein